MKHLKLHGLLHILSLAEPQDQVITLFHTTACKTYSVIEVCQLIAPLLYTFSLLKLFEHTDTFIE